MTLSHRFDFRPGDAAVASASHATAEAAIDALIARSASLHEGADGEAAAGEPASVVRNHCIREQLSYDFGEMVDANLMNTCSEPLMVYSCAEGLGRYHRRWVCQSSENVRSILVQPGDRLAGNTAMVEVPEGVRTYKYAEDFFVARARNTTYSGGSHAASTTPHVAAAAAQWARSMGGKEAAVRPATVDGADRRPLLLSTR